VSEILNAQTACKSNGQSYDESIEILRKHALENGQTLKMFAQRMAKCDEIGKSSRQEYYSSPLCFC
jgi:hypothetical protein